MIRVTALGWKAAFFFATLLVAFYSAPYQNLFFLLLVFLVALGASGALSTLRNGAGVSGEVLPVRPFAAGSPATFEATLSAPRDHLHLRVVLQLGQTATATAACPLVAGETRVRGDLAALPRGVHAVRGASIETTYPLGILRVRRQIPAPKDIVVYPAPAALRNQAGGGLAGLAQALGAGHGNDQPSGLRDWRDGDEVRRVHWRATARRGHPVVAEWDAVQGDGLEVVLDRRCPEPELESALSTIAALVIAARDTKERLTLHTQGLSRTYGPGHGTWDECLRALAEAQTLPTSASAPPPAATTVLRLPTKRARVPA